jgi:tripartite-type tricarboxylate transporter receptor subunit TctC
MKISRRSILRLAASASTLPALRRVAWAQTYPARPVRIVVGIAPGSATDILARLIGQWLSDRLGQQFIIENRPGGGTSVATEAVVRAPADGYTLLMIGPSSAINTTLYENLNYVFLRDIAPIASLVRGPDILVVNPSVPARTMAELIAYAKANPGKISAASAGVGTAPHLDAELLKMLAGIDIVHVPYRGSALALTDVLAGQVQMIFIAPSTAIEYIRAGTLRPLAVTTATRWSAIPEIPPMSEFVPGYETSTWFGIVAARNTPAGIIELLNKEINAGLADPRIEARLADLGSTPFAGTPADFGRFIAGETEKWAKVIRSAKIKAE